MRHTPQGTFIEKGDPHHLSFRLGNCPLCGADLSDENRLTSGTGHLKSLFGIKILFYACKEHFKEAEGIPIRMPHKQGLGYKGQWEPKFGLLVEVHCSEAPTKSIRLV